MKYLESLLYERKREENIPVLDDGTQNDVLARREAEWFVFELVDRNGKEHEMVTRKKLVLNRRLMALMISLLGHITLSSSKTLADCNSYLI